MMRLSTLRSIAAAAICAATLHPAVAASGPELTCAVDARTDRHMCIRESEVREREGIRWAPLYAGGPNKVRKTTNSVHANCAARVLHLKDASGVSFGGGRFSSTKLAGNLGRLVCGVTIKTQSSKK